MPHDLSHIEPALRPLAVDIRRIKADPRNARRHDPANLAAIRRSLEGFGQQRPILIDGEGVCVAGNGTLAAARSLGWTHIAALPTTLSGAAARAYAIADNRTADLSAWDERALSEALAALQNDESLDHTLTGFDDQAIDAAIAAAFNLDESGTAGGKEADDLPPEAALGESYQVLAGCAGEKEQRALYERLTREGYPCRVLTL